MPNKAQAPNAVLKRKKKEKKKYPTNPNMEKKHLSVSS